MREKLSAVTIYRLAAISNFVATVPAFVAYDRSVALFAEVPPNYPFLVWIWAGMAFLWGVMFWEISRDPIGRSPMIKYSYLEKAITSTSVLIAYISGNVPAAFVIAIIVTDIMWIPLFVWVHVRVLRRASVVYS
jgi:hypothetical protein